MFKKQIKKDDATSPAEKMFGYKEKEILETQGTA